VKLKFVTNTTKEPLRLLHEKLTQIGFRIEKDEIFTSLTAARNLVTGRGLRPLLLLEESAKEDFTGIWARFQPLTLCGIPSNGFNHGRIFGVYAFKPSRNEFFTVIKIQTVA